METPPQGEQKIFFEAKEFFARDGLYRLVTFPNSDRMPEVYLARKGNPFQKNNLYTKKDLEAHTARVVNEVFDEIDATVRYYRPHVPETLEKSIKELRQRYGVESKED